jgi:hypothetical protein
MVDGGEKMKTVVGPQTRVMRTRMKRDGMLSFWRKMMMIWSRTLIWMKFRVILCRSTGLYVYME